MSLTVKIKGDASQFDKTMRGVKATVGGLSSKIGAIGTAAAGAAAGYVTLSKAMEFLQSASEKAAGIESLTMQFETLLGSSTAAKKRMEEIAKFAASTPFEIAELSATSKLLQTMGGNLLATGEGLRMVGDAAAITGQPLQEVGLHIGRLFNAITSGTSAGESVARLQELGLISGNVKREFESLAEAQKKGLKPAKDTKKEIEETTEKIKDLEKRLITARVRKSEMLSSDQKVKTSSLMSLNNTIDQITRSIEESKNKLNQLLNPTTSKGEGKILTQAEALEKLKGILSSTDGAMARLSTTTEGLKSNLKDNVDTLMVKFGTGFNNGLKVALKLANDFLPQLQSKFTDAGELVGAALIDAMSGNTKKFELIGELIGAVIAAGIKSQVKKTLVGSMEDFLAEMVAGGEMATTRLKGRELALQASQEKDPVKGAKMLIDASRMMKQKSSFQTMYEEGKQYQNRTSQMTSVMRELQPQIDAIQFEQGMTNAMSKSITRDMPRAVREGILEGQRQAREKATFSN